MIAPSLDGRRVRADRSFFSAQAAAAISVALTLFGCNGGNDGGSMGQAVGLSAPPPNTTTLSQIPHPTHTVPAPAAFASGTCSGCSGAQNLYYVIPSRPANGYDALRFTMLPMTDTSDLSGVPLDYYWALQDGLVGANTFYFGLQPNGQYGKTALFSAFGTGTSSDPTYPYCFSGADGGSGTSCHIPYAWSVGKQYDFTVTLVGQSATQREWEGRVVDVATGTATLIGDIVMTSTAGIDADPLAFDEYFGYASYPCPNEPASRILFFTPVGYYQGVAYPGSISSLNQNSGCNVSFSSDGSTYTYIDAGT